MSTSLKTTEQNTVPVEILDSLASISNNNTIEIKDLFGKFEINRGFNAHKNLIIEIISICEHDYNKRIFESLEIYQKLLQNFLPYAKSDLDTVAGQGAWSNPVKHVSKRPIAALILMDKSYKNTQLNPIYVLTQLVSLAVYADTGKSPRNLKLIVKAANEVPQPTKPIRTFS